MRWVRFGIACGIVFLVGVSCRALRPATSDLPEGRHHVGYRVVDFDAGSQKKIAVAIWYPTDAEPGKFRYGSGKIVGRVSLDAPVKPGPWPLLVFSHGFGGSGIGQHDITEAVAARGWVVAALDHGDPVTTLRIRGGEKGDFAAARDHLHDHPFTRKEYAYRPGEVKATLDGMLAAKEQFNIDPARVALGGHSMGGWSAMMLALSGEPRARGIVLYSMGEVNWLVGRRYFEDDELARVPFPSIYFYGAREEELHDRGAYAELLFAATAPPTYLVEVPDGNHFTYNDRESARRLGGKPYQFEFIVERTIAFLDRHVCGGAAHVDATKAK